MKKLIHMLKCRLFPKYREAARKADLWGRIMAANKSIMEDYK